MSCWPASSPEKPRRFAVKFKLLHSGSGVFVGVNVAVLVVVSDVEAVTVAVPD